MQTLTIEAAKAYVTERHAEGSETVDIEGAGFVLEGDTECVRLNVTVTNAAGLKSAVQWDVWCEPLMDGALYGEC